MELEKTQKNVGKMLERFRKGKEDMSVVFTKGSSFSRGGKDEQGCYSRGRVIIFRNEKKIVDGSYNSKSSDLPKSFQCCIREGDDARCQMIFSCKEAGLGWVLCGFEPREENEDCYTIVLHCVDSVPAGLYAYDVRHDDDCRGIPCEIAPFIMVNHWGTIILAEPLELPNDGRRYIDEETDWNYDPFGGAEKNQKPCVTVEEFMNQYLNC